MRVDDVLLRSAFVKILVSAWGFIQRDDRRVDSLCDLDLVVQNSLHQLPVVAQHRALAGVEGVGLGPSESDSNAEVADFGIGIDAARVAGDIEAGNAEGAAGACDFHDGVEYGRGSFDARIFA